jgi:hypothetical protein
MCEIVYLEGPRALCVHAEDLYGAGKTTVMIAAHLTLLPDMTRLPGGDRGICCHRPFDCKNSSS